jgi:hypothetical protein
MEKRLFKKLVRSLKEAASIAHGKEKPSRQFTASSPKDPGRPADKKQK